MTDLIKVNIPGRVVDFYEGGEAWIVYQRGDGVSRNLSAGELELFTAVDAGKAIRPSKGGYYVRVELSPEAIEAARYWADTLANSSGDEAAWGDPDARNDVRAANRLLTTLSKARRDR